MSSFMEVRKAELIALQMRRARLVVCPRCDTEVWSGLDDDVCAVPAVVTAQPVSVEDGFRAVLDGLDIYTLMPAPEGGRMLYRRDEWTYGEDRWPCLVQHRCPEPEVPAEQPQNARRAAPRPEPRVSRKAQRQAARAEREARGGTRRSR